MQVTIGVDVGNFDTKGKHTSTVSGYTMYDNEQLLADKVLEYNGKYFVESIDNRFPFVEDKTANDQCLILTLFAIAKEIIYRLEEKGFSGKALQEEISKIDTVNLPIGLPPGHFNKLAPKTISYYTSKMKDGIRFNYAGYSFSFKLGHMEIYAQDLTAVLMNQDLSVTNGENTVSKYYIIGIGGYTVDIIPIINGVPDVDNCRSLPLGTRPMFETIMARVQSSTGITLDEATTEDILRGRGKYFLPEEAVTEIKRNAKIHADQIIDKCIQAGCTLNYNPAVYVGGGCLLLKEYLEQNKKVCFSEFVMDTHANAAKYEDFLKLKYQLDR